MAIFTVQDNSIVVIKSVIGHSWTWSLLLIPGTRFQESVKNGVKTAKFVV